MSKIQILSDHLASQIAAGEVVERPASVIKELLENSLDAGARSIDVELHAGGKRRMIVTDDGSGMDENDALLAFDRHATSKIRSFEDLETVASLGFRGEALASIAAVARVELLTAAAAGEGVRVRIEGGRVRSVQPIGAPQGTRLEVASLFFNVPARRKFLKAPATEMRRVLEVVQGYALARPDVRFVVTHEGRTLLEAPAMEAGLRGARRRIAQLFGAGLADALLELEPDDPVGAGMPSERDEAAPIDGDRVAESIWGFVGDRSTTRGRRMFVFVNRRLLRDRAVLATFYRSVREEWKGDEFPALFLFLDLPPEDVDVNVHPQKSEVRFRDPGLLRRVEQRLRSVLAASRGEEDAPLRSPETAPAAPFVWQGMGEVRELGLGGPGRGGPEQGGSGESSRTAFSAGFAGSAETPIYRSQEMVGRIADVAYAPIESSEVPLTGRSGKVRPFRLLGQYKGTLLLLEGPDGLYLIDQHVAHERILYEQFRRDLESESPASQQLVAPVVLEVGPSEAVRLGEVSPALAALGFELRELSGGSLGLTAVPAALKLDQAQGVLMALASNVDREITVDELRRKLLDDLAASQACKAAVKMHEPLSPAEMESLVSELFLTEQPYACPHGRPIVLQMTDRELERRFGRR